MDMDLKIFLGFLCTMLAFYLPPYLYFRYGHLFVWFYHNILGWHIPDDEEQTFDGCSTHAHCKHCGKEIMQDSQGNWF